MSLDNMKKIILRAIKKAREDGRTEFDWHHEWRRGHGKSAEEIGRNARKGIRKRGGRMNIRKFKRLAIKSLEINPEKEEKCLDTN